MSESVEQLRFAVEAFLAELKDGTVSASRMVNPLLNLWQLANSLDPAAAVPLETLLSAIAQRNLIAKSELKAVLDEVVAAATPLAEASPVG